VTRAGDEPASTYTLRRVQAMLGLSRTIVAGLIAEGFVAPTRGPRNEWRFTFQDLMLLRTAHALQASKIPPRKILRSLARLKATLPRELPLTGLRITAIGATSKSINSWPLSAAWPSWRATPRRRRHRVRRRGSSAAWRSKPATPMRPKPRTARHCCWRLSSKRRI
jgi:hypothetical protein